MNSKSSRRFRREALGQLASLNHNIVARFYDTGEEATPLPDSRKVSIPTSSWNTSMGVRSRTSSLTMQVLSRR